MTTHPKHRVEPLFSEEQIITRVRELAQQVVKDYQDKELYLVAILSGAATLMADFERELWKLGKKDVVVDYMGVESYSGTLSSKVPKITKDLKNSIAGKEVLIVEDIIDTGHSLHTLHELLSSRGAGSIKVLALFSKPSRREVEVQIDYVGFEIPDEFVVGYGLDWDEEYRHMPGVGKVVLEK